MVSELLEGASVLGPIAGQFSGQDKSSALISRSSAESASSGNKSTLSTGSFSVGGGQTTNTVFIIAGVIALAFLLSKFFKK